MLKLFVNMHARISPISSDPQIVRTWFFHEKIIIFYASFNSDGTENNYLIASELIGEIRYIK